MLPEKRDTLDVSGHRVDLYPSDSETYLSVAAVAADLITEDTLRECVFKSMREMSIFSSRLRDRDFTVYVCSWELTEGNFVGIGLPIRFPSQLHRLFRMNLRQHSEIADTGRSLAIDVGARPFVLYNHGALVAYVDPFEPVKAGLFGKDVELRSSAYKPMRNQARRRKPLPVIRQEPPQKHSIAVWLELRSDILEFIYETIQVGSFFSLQRAMRRQFGMSVRTASIGLAGRHGSIRTSWITPDDLSCDVTIYINSDLPTQLKYVVLAHEIAHYVLHFPILLAGQMSEQASWFRPHIECAYHQLFSGFFGDGQQLEEQADALASYLLFPPQVATTFFGVPIMERSRVLTPEEITWRALADFFPERSSVEYSWHNWEEMNRQADRELQRGDGFNDLSDRTLYRSMLRATVRREADEFADSSGALNRHVEDFWAQINDIDPRTVCVVAHAIELTAAQIDSTPDARNILPPVVGSVVDARRIPLVPAVRHKINGEWTCVLDPSGPSYGLDEWRQLYSDYAMILYPNRPLPDRALAHVIEEDS
jgi:Zn-dependent peptidase ImmA (M78 family)